MRNFLFGLIFGVCLTLTANAHATIKYREIINSFSDDSLPVLNEILRQMRTTLDEHDSRLTAGGL